MLSNELIKGVKRFTYAENVTGVHRVLLSLGTIYIIIADMRILVRSYIRSMIACKVQSRFLNLIDISINSFAYLNVVQCVLCVGVFVCLFVIRCFNCSQAVMQIKGEQ